MCGVADPSEGAVFFLKPPFGGLRTRSARLKRLARRHPHECWRRLNERDTELLTSQASKCVTDMDANFCSILPFSSPAMAAQKNNKKRSAPTDLESKPKRRSAETELPRPAEKKRSRPVTHTFPIVEESDSEDVDEGGDADVAVDDEPPTDENAMEVETEINQQKDPNGMLHL